MNLKHPKTRKEVQQLNGKIAALHKFIPDKRRPFLKLLRNPQQYINWDSECEKVVQEIKRTLAMLPMLYPPKGA